MGIYLFTTQRRTPTTIITRKMFNSGIINDLKMRTNIFYNLLENFEHNPTIFFEVLHLLNNNPTVIYVLILLCFNAVM